MEANQVEKIGETEEALTERLRQVDQEILETEKVSREMDQATKDMLAKTAKIEEKIEATRKRRYMLEKINESLQKYSSALDRAINDALVRTAKAGKKIKATEEEINKINRMMDHEGKMAAEQDPNMLHFRN